eukprot:scaffold11223_cov57-Attheya_sp.AAC.11
MDQCFYCVEARDNEDDRIMTIKDLWFDPPLHARNKPTQGSLNTQWIDYSSVNTHYCKRGVCIILKDNPLFTCQLHGDKMRCCP